MKKELYEISFRCFYDNDTHTTHRQSLALKDIPKWIDAYKFTHPDVMSISIKIWFES